MASTKITTGGSFAGAIDYDEKNGNNKKDQEKIAKLPATPNEILAPGFEAGIRSRLLSTNLSGSKSSEFTKQLENNAKQKPDIKKPVHKVSINFKPGEHLKTHQLVEISESYLKTMGYKNAPYLVYEHREKEHQHVHLISSKIDFNGDVVSDSFEKYRAREWANDIEDKYGLAKTPRRAKEKGLSMVEIAQAQRTGKPPPKLVLQEVIKRALRMSRNASEFIQLLEKQNISVIVRTNEKQQIIGISYGINGQGFKASNLGTTFTWKGLKKEGLNYEYGRDYKKLEEAGTRASRGKYGPTKSEPDRVVIQRPPVDDGRKDRAISRENNQTTQKAGIGPGERTAHNQTGVGSVPRTAAADEREIERQYRESEKSDTSELQRFRGSLRGKTETSGQSGSKKEFIPQAAADETDTEFTAATDELNAEDKWYAAEPIPGNFNLFRPDVFTEELSGTGSTELFIEPTGLTGSDSTEDSQGNNRAIAGYLQIFCENVSGDGQNAIDSRVVIGDDPSRNMADDQAVNLVYGNDDGIPATQDNDVYNSSHSSSGMDSVYWNTATVDDDSRMRSDTGLLDNTDLSSGFRESLETACEPIDKIISVLEDDSEKRFIEEIEQEELEENIECKNDMEWDMDM
jgi:hypothetical protein